MMKLVVLSCLLAAASASYVGSPVVAVSPGWGHDAGWGHGGWGNGGWGNGGWGNGGWGHGGWGNGGWGSGAWDGGWGHGNGAGWGNGWGNGWGGAHGYSTVVKTAPVVAAAPVVVKTAVAPVATSYSSSWKAPAYGGYGHGGWGGWNGVGSGYGWGHAATSYQNLYKVSKPLYGGLGYGHGYGYGGHGGWW